MAPLEIKIFESEPYKNRDRKLVMEAGPNGAEMITQSPMGCLTIELNHLDDQALIKIDDTPVELEIVRISHSNEFPEQSKGKYLLRDNDYLTVQIGGQDRPRFTFKKTPAK